MTEPAYVAIYCSAQAQDEAKHLIAHPEYWGRAFAEKVDGEWRCCCCGKSVKVVW